MPAPETLVVIPTYNEKDNAPAMARAVLAALPPSGGVLFADDNSPDGTGVALDAIAAREPRVRVLHRPRKEGLGRAYVHAFSRALEEGARFIVQMDCDFSHDPSDIPRLLEAARSADVAIGSRYVPGGGTPGWPLRRRLVSRAGGAVIRVVTGMPLRDPTGGFRCFRREALEKIDLAAVRSSGYSFQLETNWRAWKAGLKIAEIPIVFRDRAAGVSKITPGIAAESLKMVFRLRFRGC